MLTQVEQVTRQTDTLKSVQSDLAESLATVSQTLIEMKDLLNDINNK
jgi:hypothetical protein